MMSDYFVIRNSDGDTYVEQYSEARLLAELESNAWGDDVVFLDKMTKGANTNYWGGAVLIIAGSITVPQAEVITKYKIGKQSGR